MNALKDHILGVQHIGYVVSDLEKSIETYKELYGIDDSHIQVLPETDDGKTPTRFAFIQVGEVQFELIQALRPPYTEMLKNDDNGAGGINHLAYRVRNLEAAVEALSQQGISPGHVTPDGIVKFGNKKIVYLNPDDIAGQLIELIEIEEA